MAEFSVNIVGCGSASPTLLHLPSCQVINYKNRLMMVDCGEGSQLQMRRMKLNFARIRHIFISHLHGDHMLGLPGLLNTMSMLDIKDRVHVYIFEQGIEWIKKYMSITHNSPNLEIIFHPVRRMQEVVYEDDDLTVETFPLYHSVPCVGYIFREKPKLRKIKGDMVEFHNVPYFRRDALRHGADFTKPTGEVIPNAMLTSDPDPSLSYAYCSDTIFSPKVIEAVKGVSTIYHESTYTSDKAEKARERGHSTARQAAIVAREAGAGKLIIGHYSKQYESEEPLRAEALSEFPNVVAAKEGMCIPVGD